MKTIAKVLGFLVGALVLVVVGGIAFVTAKYPAVAPPSTETFEYTPERIERGRYLVEHIADCFTCHADHHDDIYGRPLKEGTVGAGGFPFDKKYHVPGLVQAQNITPDPETGLGNWTDGEIIRAIREGIGRDGRALFPMMPYEFFVKMSDEDARSTVAYLRQLQPIKNKVQDRQLNFPFNLVVRFYPKPVPAPNETPQDTPPETWKDPKSWEQHLDYGDYVVTVAGCVECHTDHNEKMERIPGREYAGGYELIGPWGTAYSANITPHKDTYIGQATKEQFIARFKAWASIPEDQLPKVEPSKNSFMPWLSFKGISEQDLGAIYDFLKNRVKPVENKVRPPDLRMTEDGQVAASQ